MSKDEMVYEEIIELTVAGEKGRIDRYLTDKLDTMSRSKIQGLIADEYVLVNDQVIKANYKVKTDDQIVVFIPEAEPIDVVAEDLPIEIIYEDQDLVVINKAQGMVVHPAPGHKSGTVVNALLYHIDDLSGINGKIRPGIVHRLDKDTSGIMVVAKNDEAHIGLSEQLEDRSMERKYWALVHGVMPHSQGTIDAPIGRDPKNRQRYAVVSGGKEARSHFKLIEKLDDYSLLEVELESGRTHQIRVHLNYIEYPVAGDELYGPKKTLEGKGQFLHARALGFVHPRTQEKMYFEAELPTVFKEQLEFLRARKLNQ